ncbi:MAG: hypothetical protein EPN84_07635 [Legionella sp.]|nr:MAG: hypothetical protein EPN84_07635 [Legionella sp.]
MLDSSADYLQALREGKYLLFLEWVEFINGSGGAGVERGGDTTLNLLVFEWLKVGFTLEDAQRVAILYAVHKQLNSPLSSGILDYSVTTLLSVTFQCMVYSAENLPKPANVDFLAQLGVSIPNFEQKLQIKVAEFSTWPIDKVKVDGAWQHIMEMVKPRELVEEYLLFLSTVPYDDFKASRTAVLRGLQDDLLRHKVMTLEVSNGISQNINLIRKMQPHEGEIYYLNALSPLSLMEKMEKCIQWATEGAQRFFSSPERNNPATQLIDSGVAAPGLGSKVKEE